MTLTADEIANLTVTRIADTHSDQLDTWLEVVCVESVNLLALAENAVVRASLTARRAGVPSPNASKTMSEAVALLNAAARMQRTATYLDQWRRTNLAAERANRRTNA